MDNTIFFGNGLNRLNPNNISWKELLDEIKDTNKFKDNNLPNTMIYERILLQKLRKYPDILEDEFEVKKEIATLLLQINPNPVYLELYNLNVQNYITTNYDYAFIDSLKVTTSNVFDIHSFRPEDIYSIRRVHKIKNTEQLEKNLWQIHGEINRPASIMLGLDQYCGSIGKIDSYIKGRYTYTFDGVDIVEMPIQEKLKKNKFSGSSWIELFFTSNLHIIGFTLDFSEIELWWILNKRSRMIKSEGDEKLIKNEIHFYCDDIDEQKKSLLESMNVTVHAWTVDYADHLAFPNYYNKLLKHLEKVTAK
jgi:hypothetical protein